jgi:hypothetical protein
MKQSLFENGIGRTSNQLRDGLRGGRYVVFVSAAALLIALWHCCSPLSADGLVAPAGSQAPRLADDSGLSRI